MTRFQRLSLLVGLVVLSLLVMVPRMSLVDDDDDGDPDLVAIAVVKSPISESNCARKDERPQDSHNTVALASDAIQFRPLGADRSDPILPDSRSILQSFCLLRC